MIAAWKKKVTICDRRVKHFPFLQKQTLLGTEKLQVSRVHQKILKASVAFSQPKTFTSEHKVYTCFYNHFCILHKDLFYVSFVGQD